MTQPGETVRRMGVVKNGKIYVGLSPDAEAKLNELANDAGMMPSRVASALLQELLPTVTGVRMRLQITRAAPNGGTPR